VVLYLTGVRIAGEQRGHATWLWSYSYQLIVIATVRVNRVILMARAPVK